jgi:tellurite resistance protein
MVVMVAVVMVMVMVAVVMSEVIRKKKSRAHAGLRGCHGMSGAAVDRVRGMETRTVKATCVRTLPTAGVTADRERPYVDIPRARTWTASQEWQMSKPTCNEHS